MSVRKDMTASRAERWALLLILLAAAALRLWHLDFGLPALNDPDEPLFVMVALDMVRDGSLNPGWFGHPATILLYALAAIFGLVGLAGAALGAWSGTDGFVAALFADPSIAILPMRGFIALCGVACVYLTYRIGRQATGARAGLLAAALLAANGLHIEYSQIIRTDMLASVFMLLSTLAALGLGRGGRPRDALLAGAMAGLACATKWPAVMILANPLGAALARRSPRLAVLAIAAAVAALFLASPFLLLDYRTVLHDLSGEARPFHLGATGGAPWQNAGWYVTHVLAASFGSFGALLVLAGAVLAIRRGRGTALAVHPGAIAFLLAIVTQSLVWERWAVPLLPFAALFAALAFTAAAKRVPAIAAGVAGVALFVPILSATQTRSSTRASDTRQAATEWVRRNVPADASILLEHAGFDLLAHPGPLLFPLGDAGCVDVRRLLSRAPRHRHVDRVRRGRTIVDLGNIPFAKLSTCQADFAIVSHHARYAAEPQRFPDALANYRRFMQAGRIVATFRPTPGKVGGPVVQVIRF